MAKNPIRILHAAGAMNQGGLETWLVHILRHIDRDRFHMDFLVHTTEPCAYDDEIRALGSRVIPCLHTHQPWSYAQNFRRILEMHGSYDIVHSHVHHYSGFVLRVAEYYGVPVRIAHSHNDTMLREAQAGLLRRAYLILMKCWIARSATVGLAASGQAAADLFGLAWEREPRWQVLYYGIELAPFYNQVDPVIVRAELNIPAEAFVIGHVGRFVEEKNHTFLVDIAAEVIKHNEQAYLLLIGDGQLRPAIEQKVRQMGLADRVVFTGTRADVPRLMLGAMDVFVLPSLYEGLPLVSIEAQAAGLPLVLSDTITKELDKVAPLIQRVPLLQQDSVWAKTILGVRYAKPAITQSRALTIITDSAFNIHASVKSLENLYCGQPFAETIIEPRIPSPGPYQFN